MSSTRSGNPRRGKGYAYRRDQLCRRVYAYYDECYICGRPVDKSLPWPDPWYKTVDETIPVARGGSPLDWGNVGLAHNWCNRVKGTHTLAWARAEVARLLDPNRTTATSMATTTSEEAASSNHLAATSMPLTTSGDW